ncbi:MAG: hypothetical protein ABJH63_14460 [Rhizobiaceae bacterium]
MMIVVMIVATRVSVMKEKLSAQLLQMMPEVQLAEPELAERQYLAQRGQYPCRLVSQATPQLPILTPESAAAMATSQAVVVRIGAKPTRRLEIQAEMPVLFVQQQEQPEMSEQLEEAVESPH